MRRSRRDECPFRRTLLPAAASLAFVVGGLAAQAPPMQWLRARTLTERADHAMAYDSARQRIVSFGDPYRQSADTWEREGTRWIHRTPATSPPARASTAMAHDAARGRVVMFGGNANSGPYFADTWEMGRHRVDAAGADGHPPAAILAHHGVGRGTTAGCAVWGQR